MDPYHTLGVRKDCTREELKEAFRVRARRLHPDRGGEPAGFIQLRQAYDQIVTDLERRPPSPSAETPARVDRRPNQPDLNSEPDLIVFDEPLPRVQPPRSPDPNWQPDLIVRDEPLPRIRPARPPDPNWQPDLIVVDGEPPRGRLPDSRDPGIARQNYIKWLRRISAQPRQEDPKTIAKWLDIARVTVLLSVIILTIWICWESWTYEPQTEPFDFPQRQQVLSP